MARGYKYKLYALQDLVWPIFMKTPIKIIQSKKIIKILIIS